MNALWNRTRLLLGALLVLAPIAPHAANGPDVGDLWWNPGESGWGMQIVQNNTTLFATIFVYDQINFPYWYTGTLFSQGTNPTTGAPTYSGDLYATKGPWFGTVPFNPAEVSSAKVGIISFTSPTINTGVLSYSVGGTSVTKNVTRQTLVYDDYNGTFAGTYAIEQYDCTNSSNNRARYLGTVFTIAHANTTINISAAMNSTTGTFSCTFNGTYSQAGRMGSINAPYSCSNGETGTFALREMTRSRLGILARIAGVNSLGCTLRGVLAVFE